MTAPSHKSPDRTIIIIVVAVLGAILAIGGVLAAFAVSGVRKYNQSMKEAEALIELGTMTSGAMRCHDNEMEAYVLPGNTKRSPKALPVTTKPVPTTLSMVSGVQYQSSAADWDQPGYRCMDFRRTAPQYFQYQWVRDSDTTGHAVARADFDGDGKPDVSFEYSVSCGGGVCQRDPRLVETR